MRLKALAAAFGTSVPAARSAGTRAARVIWPPTHTVAARTCRNRRNVSTVTAFMLPKPASPASGTAGGSLLLAKVLRDRHPRAVTFVGLPSTPGQHHLCEPVTGDEERDVDEAGLRP